PEARVRLTTPTGQAVIARADPGGRWRFVLASAPGMRLFGLAMIEGPRTLQAEGYLAVTPRDEAVQLRAGAGARAFTPGGVLRLLAVDYDRKGGTVVSGTGRPGDTVSVRIDGLQKGRIAADAAGRFTLALDEPLSGGDHRVEADDAAARAEAAISISPPAPLERAAFAASIIPSGWRIDWMTPGGAVQTTLLIARAKDNLAQGRP
ncbi:MAG: Ig-like domain-containing protein, partial [Pseudomonadota bacterium]|nr:Ig-like domain-containing protein [Pseudomonadota bacterium]